MKNLIVRTVTGILFAMEFLFAFVTGLTLWEYTGIVNSIGNAHTNRFISVVAGVYFFLATGGFCSGMVPTGAVFIPYLLTMVYLFISELYKKAANPINNWAYTTLGQIYIALPFSMINVLAFNAQPDGQVAFNCIIPLSMFVFLWANDSGAYCFGSMFGRHKLFPRISPGKSWEGSAGGAITGHGGMLDRFDSSLMAMPAAVLYLYSLTLFGGGACSAM